jgi:flavin-dependent dehydrogenase
LQETQVIVVGGGPAGSSCARRLRQLEIDCLILDKAKFPRHKLCAGWITPEVVTDLELDPANYPHRWLTFETTRVHLFGIDLRLRSPQHSIRRYEFDAWLLARAGVDVLPHAVKQIRQQGGRYIVDERFVCDYLVGAGGTGCPVYHALFRAANPRSKVLQVVALEQEFPCVWDDGDCHLWFFDKGLPGYSWYVPKQDGFLNLGTGAMAARLKRKGEPIRLHWERFVARLQRRGLVDQASTLAPLGYSYYLRDTLDIGRLDNAFVIGDAAGLATRDMAEGIGPAVRSGIQAADAIAGVCEYDLRSVSAHSLPRGLPRRGLEYLLAGRRRPAGAPEPRPEPG